MASERVVKVTLTAQMQNYLAGMEKARKVTSEAASEAQKLAQTKQQFDQLGRASLAAGALMAVGLGVAISKFAQFDQAMSNVQAATHETAENMDLLSKAALDAGASTVYSATEAAGAIEELAKAGISTSDILQGGLKGALDLAAAGGIEVAEAAGIAATTMQQFQLKGYQAAHVADLLAAGAGKAMGDVGDMSQALKQSGLVANQFGISVEETTGTLAAFASAGLLGSDAGTSFRTMLLRLANPTGEVKDLMKQLGIEAYDAGGNFIGLSGLAGELETSLVGMTDQQKQATLATIFGQDAIRAATVLYEEGAAGIAEWTQKVDDAGYAAETAETRLDNLKGDVEALQGAVDTAMISMGSAADGPLRAFVQALTGLVDKFNDLPSGAQQAFFWVGAVGTAGATALGTYLLLVPKIAEFNAALEVLGPRAQRASRAVTALSRIGAIGVTIGAAAIGVDLLAEAISEKLLPSTAQVDNKFRTAKSGVELFTAALYKEGITNSKQASALLKELGANLDAVADSDFWHPANISGTAVSVIKSIAETAKTDLPSAQAQFRKLAEDGELTDKQLRTMIKTVPELQDALIAYADTSGGAASTQDLLNIALGDAEDSTEANEDALRALAGQAVSTGEEVDGLADQIRNFGAATLSTRDAQRQFEQALDDLTDSITENGTSLDVTTQQGRDNQAAIDDLAKSALEFAAATYEQTGSQEDANAVLQTGRDRLIEMLGQFGITGQAAEEYADNLGLIPENIATYVDLNTADAEKKLDQLTRVRTVNILAAYNGLPQPAAVGSGTVLKPDGRASGGAIHGPGSGTSDTAGLYALSNGEHVLTAEDVRRMGGQNAVYALRNSLYGGSPAGSTTVSLAGATITMLVDGVPMRAVIQEQIVSANAAQDQDDNAGRRRRF